MNEKLQNQKQNLIKIRIHCRLRSIGEVERNQTVSFTLGKIIMKRSISTGLTPFTIKINVEIQFFLYK